MPHPSNKSFLDEQFALSGEALLPDVLADAPIGAPSLNDLEALQPETLRAEESRRGPFINPLDRARSLLQNGDLERAKQMLLQTVDAAPHSADARALLGAVYLVTSDPAAALPHLVRASEIQPVWAELRRLCGEAALQSGQLESASAYFRRALELKPDWPDVATRLGETLIKLGDYEQGWQLYGSRWRSSAVQGPGPDQRVPIWTGAEPLAGRSILILAEQGLNELFMFVRYATLLKQRGARVAITCPGDLVDLIHTVPGVGQAIAFGQALPAVNYQIPLLNLPAAFRTTLGTVPHQVPYLAAGEHFRRIWSGRLPSITRPQSLKIGVLWSGYPGETMQPGVAIPLTALRPLWAIEGVTWFSLATGPAANDLLHDDTPLVDLAEEIDSADSFAALVEQLDAVVAIDTAVLHIAGALERPAFVPLNKACHFRWPGTGERTPWYPSLRLFRQPVEGDWTPAVEKMARAITNFVRSHSLPPSPFTF